MLDHQKQNITNAMNFSHYLTRIIQNNEKIFDELTLLCEQKLTDEYFSSFADWYQLDETTLKQKLRQLRQLVIGQLIVRDLNLEANLAEVTGVISIFANFAVNTTLNIVQNKYIERYGSPIGAMDETPQNLTVIGMGKLGGLELNVSSDIDLIFTYPQAGQTNGSKSISNQEFFIKVGKKLISILNDITEDGFVFRVDMRLRPHGDSGPLVCSESALEQYLISQGREWERYAWLKARVMTPAENGISQLIRPFIYRKYLDFNAYESMRNLYQQIKLEVARKNKFNNIKLGSGGIREAEFIAQLFQLIWGGKNKSLQLKGTQETLIELAKLNFITEQTKDDLLAGYRFLRKLEHRLQYLDDQQTHALPENESDQNKIALSMGYDDYNAFLNELNQHREKIKAIFDDVLELPDESKKEHPLFAIWHHDLDEQFTAETLTQLGYDGAQTQSKLITLKNSTKYEGLSSHALSLFDTLIPQLIDVCAHTKHKETSLFRFLEFLETISRRSSYLAFLCEHPETLKPLADIFSASSSVSSYLMNHPILLDELLNDRLLIEKPNWTELSEELEQSLNQYPESDTESKMDALRHFQHAQTFRLAVQDLSGVWSVEILSDHLSFLADTLIKSAFKHVWLGLKNKHCAEPKMIVVGYGKLGGKELSYTSDLDLVYLYQDTDPRAVDTYSRFIRRLNTWLSSNTGAGTLYNIDLRLRPNGESGLLICSFESFLNYQKTEAWTWEHQALTRARFISGDEETGELFENFRKQILTLSRDKTFIQNEILTMRNRILTSHPPVLKDVKYARGGIIDVEFLVQYFILTHSDKYPDLTHNYGNIALLGIAAAHQLIDQILAEQCQTAYRYYRQTIHLIKLYDDEIGEENAVLLAHYQKVKLLWKNVFNQEI